MVAALRRGLFFVIFLILAFACFAERAGAQSLWRNDGPYSNFIRNNTARSVGDLLTVVIAESASIQNTEQTKTERSGSLNAKLSNFDIAPKAFNTLPAFGGSHSQTFDGKADQTRQDRFETRIQVQVNDVLPNSNLLVVGRRTITVDDETKTIEIRGVVRPQDVAVDNTVKSEQVASAEISYVGDGQLSRAATKGVVARVFDFVFHLLWPF